MEQKIIKLLKEDREKGAALLLETYAGLLWSVCAKRLQNEEDIKECVNSTFAEFCLRSERYDENKGSLKNYLCEIADRRAIDLYRKNERNRRVEEAAFAKEKAEWETQMKQQEESEMLKEALEKLEPIDSQILRMKYYGGMTYEEIAKTLGMSHESVKKRGFRGRKKLLYIILVGLIIAVLAACAAVIMRKYKFSPWKGFLSSEEPAYEFVEGAYEIELSDVKLSLQDAFYCNGDLELEFCMEWLEEGQVGEQSIVKRIEKLKDKELTIQDMCFDQVDYISGNFTGSNPYDTRKRIFMLHYIYDLKDEDAEILSFNLCFNDTETISLQLQKLKMLESEESVNGITLTDGSRFLFGKGYVGDDGLSILNLYQKDMQEYAISELIVDTYMGTHGKEAEVLTLTDEDGNEYSHMRCSGEDINQMGLRREYNLYFKDVASGTYTLTIPYICVQKQMLSEPVTLELPVEEDSLTCNCEVLFPDGTGFRITEIRREYFEQIARNFDEDGTFEGETVTPYYKYYLEYEPIIVDELEFLVAMGKGENLMFGVAEGDTPFLKIQGAELQEKAEVSFENPYYMIHESYEVTITIEELAK